MNFQNCPKVSEGGMAADPPDIIRLFFILGSSDACGRKTQHFFYLEQFWCLRRGRGTETCKQVTAIGISTLHVATCLVQVWEALKEQFLAAYATEAECEDITLSTFRATGEILSLAFQVSGKMQIWGGEERSGRTENWGKAIVARNVMFIMHVLYIFVFIFAHHSCTFVTWKNAIGIKSSLLLSNHHHHRHHHHYKHQ